MALFLGKQEQDLKKSIVIIDMNIIDEPSRVLTLSTDK